jgi:hypothetical protein
MFLSFHSADASYILPKKTPFVRVRRTRCNQKECFYQNVSNQNNSIIRIFLSECFFPHTRPDGLVLIYTKENFLLSESVGRGVTKQNHSINQNISIRIIDSADASLIIRHILLSESVGRGVINLSE